MIWHLFFLLLIQYFIVQFIVATRIPNYSVVTDYISALGDKTKSPLFSLMNVSFFINGVLILLGSLSSNKDVTSKALLSVSALGALLVAVNPENKNAKLHVSGAALSFIFGNLSILSLGIHSGNASEKAICYSGAAVGLFSIPLFLLKGQYKGLTERLVSYPQSLVLIGTGALGVLGIQ